MQTQPLAARVAQVSKRIEFYRSVMRMAINNVHLLQEVDVVVVQVVLVLRVEVKKVSHG
jgi:hypothetical protein